MKKRLKKAGTPLSKKAEDCTESIDLALEELKYLSSEADDFFKNLEKDDQKEKKDGDK